MAKIPFSIDFIPSSKDHFKDDIPPIPHKVPTQRARKILSIYQKQMDNFNEMLQNSFENWPSETIVNQDTLTWLSQADISKICTERNEKEADYLACTFHNEPSIKDFWDNDFPIAGSHTYISADQPKSMWGDIGTHEKDHHAASSAKQSMFFDAVHNANPHKISTQRKILHNSIHNINKLNDYIETTDWLKRNPHGKYYVEKHLNHEPKIRLKLYDYIDAMEDLNDD